MNSPKISVIIPVYKVAKYLRKCIDSVLNQTFQDFEIILVSDGPDEDDRICEEYVANDSRISLIKGINKGLGGARNAGIRAAKAPYIVTIDSDDWIESQYLEKMYYGVEQGADIVQCGTNIVFEGEINSHLKKCDDEYFAIKHEGLIDLSNDIFGNINVGSWNKLYKKELIKRYNLEFPENLRNEDALFTWKYWSVCKKMYCIPDKLYNYLRRDDSLMAKTFAKQMGKEVLNHLKVGKFLYDFLTDKKLFKERKTAFFNAYQVCYWFVRDNASLEYKEIGHKIAREFLKKLNIPREYKYLRKIKKMDYKNFNNERKTSLLKKILSVKNSENKTHKVVTLLGLKFKFKRNKRQYKYYDVQGINNKIIILEKNGTERELKYNEKIDGLHIVMAGKDNLVKIHKPYKFINCNFNINSTKAYFEILDNNIWGVCNLNVRCMFGENQILKIGRNTTFSGGYINLDEDSGLIIGDDCMFGGHLSFFPSDGHSVIDLDKKSILNKVVAPIIIGDHVWIGEHSIILKNAHIKSNSIVAAGSVVTKSFDFKNVIIAGNPAKIIKHNCTWDRTSPMYLNKVLKEKTNA